MGGAVAGLGMRWKAFASADMLLQNENAADQMISYMEALKGLQIMIYGTSPEWVHIGKFDKPTMDWFLSDGIMRSKDPWGFGKGGGVSFHQRASPGVETMKVVEGELQSSAAEDPGMRNDDGLWLFPGRRVRIHGLVIHADLNERKGTLIEEVGPGTWHVKLDDGHGEKLLKVQNMKTLAGVPLDVHSQDEKQGVPILQNPIEAKKPADKNSFEFCLAGTWTGWEPQDMQWDPKQQCFFSIVHLNAAGGFGISRGKAGEKWKVQKQEWRIGTRGHFQIRLFISDSGKVKKVDWIMPGTATSDEASNLRVSTEDEKTSQPVNESKNKEVIPASVASPPPAAVAERQRSIAESAPSHSYCIAGTWLDWIPQDMQWDPNDRCFFANAYIEGRKQGGFGICRGKAGSKWKSQREEWVIRQEGHYMIRLYVKDSGGIKKVDWIARADLQDSGSSAK